MASVGIIHVGGKKLYPPNKRGVPVYQCIPVIYDRSYGDKTITNNSDVLPPCLIACKTIDRYKYDTYYVVFQYLPDIVRVGESVSGVVKRGAILRIIGSVSVLENEYIAILTSFGLIGGKMYTNKVNIVPGTDVVSGREDLTHHKCTFTVDPEHSKDLDDAITITKDMIMVHIADVSSYIDHVGGSHNILEDIIKDRITSVYAKSQVYNMLPEHWSNNVCSLLPDTDRRTVTVKFSLSDFKFIEVCRSTIRSRTQISYDEFSTTSNICMIRDSYNILCDLTKHDDPHKIIEVLMVKVNTCIANLLANKHIPFIVRSQQSTICKSGDYGHLDLQYRKYIDHTTSNAAMYKVYTGGDGDGGDGNEYAHSGLSAGLYTHFTSPIRRYVDIVTHRLLLGYGGGDNVVTLTKIADMANKVTKNQKRAQRAMDLLEFYNDLSLLQGHEQCTIDGVVTRWAITDHLVKVWVAIKHKHSIITVKVILVNPCLRMYTNVDKSSPSELVVSMSGDDEGVVVYNVGLYDHVNVTLYAKDGYTCSNRVKAHISDFEPVMGGLLHIGE